MAGWTAVRLIRWPVQSKDRLWCEAHEVPRVLLVEQGHALPEPGPREVVLPQTADGALIAAAVDELAAGPSASTPGAGRLPGRTVGRVAAGALAAAAACAR